MAFIYDLSDTWNNAGISFSGIKINVTDSASAAGSKLLDLQIGSASKFTVGKTGTVTATGLIESTVGGFKFPDGTTQITRAVTSVTSTDGSVAITGTTSVDLSAVFATSASNLLLPVRNITGATLTKGTAVYISGATGQISTVSKAIATGDSTSAQTLGLVTANIANNANGNVTLIGTITNIDTSAYTDGQQLYLSPTTAGTLTATKPYAPQHLVYMAVVEHAHPTQGKLFVKVQNGYELDELHNVSAQTPSNNHGIFYNTATSLWENKSIVTALGYTPYNSTNPAGYTTNVGTVTSVAGTGTVSGLSLTGSVTTSGSLTLGGTLILTSGQVTDGLGYTPYNATNPAGYTTNVGTVTSVSGTGTVNGLTLTGSVTTSGSLTLGGTLGNIANSQLTNSAITINGTSTALGGSISVGTVTSVAALTLGTSGTDLASSVANGTTTPVITLNVPTASATNRGALSSSDWSTFNAKQAALVSGTNIKTVGGASLLGSGDVGTIGLAYGGTGATTASGARTALGLGTAAVLNAGVSGGVATLDGSGTVPTSQLPGAVLGGLNYQGTWNASTNTPTLASSTGSKGYYYVVSVAGSTNLNGITDWKIGDWAVYDGTTWQKVDNTDAVSSVNGYTGAVVLTTSDVAQGTNLYFTQAAARGSVSAGTGISYDSGTGVITNSAPDQTVALTGAGTTVVTGTYPNFTITSNDSTVGTVTSVGGTGTVSGLTLTGTVTTSGNLTLGGTLAVTPSNFASQTANTVLAAPNGAAGVPTFRAIVAADIPTLNQNTTGTASNVTGTVAVGNGGTGATSLTSGYLLKGNGTSAVSASVVYDNGTNVGIGTASPSAKLTVDAGNILLSNAYSLSGRNAANTLSISLIGRNASDQVVIDPDGYGTLIGSGGTLGVFGSGNVGIGTSSPGAKLDVDVGGTPGVGLIVKGSSLTSSQVNIGISVVTAGRPFVGTNTSTNPLEIGTRAAVDMLFLTNTTERMRINSSGNVGIGTSSPSIRLQVSDVDQATARIGVNNVNGQNYHLVAGNPGASNSGFAIFDATASATRMYLDSSGNVGVGTSSPAYKLDVNGVTRLGAGSPAILAGVGGAFAGGQGELYTVSTNTMGLGTTGVASMQLYTNSAERMRIDSSGNVGIGTTTPSVKLNVTGTAGDPTLNAASGIAEFYLTTTQMLAIGGYASGSYGLWLQGKQNNGGYTTSTFPIILNPAGGNVGIGLTPSVKFQVAGTARVNQPSATRYRSDWYLESGNAYMNGFDDTGGVYIPLSLNFSSYTFNSGASERMRIDSSGNTLLGTTTAKNRLTVSAAANTNAPTLGSAGGVAYFANTDVAYGLNVGTSASDGHTWLQAQRTDGTATAYNITLNEAGGNVGIGTSSPAVKLDVNGGINFGQTMISGGNVSTGDTAFELGGNRSGSGNSYIDWHSTPGTDFESRIIRYGGANAGMDIINMGTGGMVISQEGAAPMVFKTTATERMRIDASGNLLVGTTTSFGKLSVFGTAGFNADANSSISGSGSYKFRGAAAGTTITTYDYLNYTAMQFIRDNGNPTNTVGSITCTDGSTSYNTSSDRRLKKDVIPAPDAGAIIDSINIVSHGWKSNDTIVPFGVIAQDLHAVAPQAVHAGDDADEIESVWGVDYSKLVPMLVKEIQSMRLRLAQLEGN